eukprot:2069103-Prymnesium_polylepis.1
MAAQKKRSTRLENSSRRSRARLAFGGYLAFGYTFAGHTALVELQTRAGATPRHTRAARTARVSCDVLQ